MFKGMLRTTRAIDKVFEMMMHVLWLGMLASVALARPNGAPTSACDSMTPRHGGNSPQDMKTNPYMVEFKKKGSGKYMYMVMLGPKAGMNKKFKGFLIQARPKGANGALMEKQIGKVVVSSLFAVR